MRSTTTFFLVRNDHVEALTGMADNTIRVSAVDRSNVEIKDRDKDYRELSGDSSRQ